jgi:tRNA pseudouridine32 synthase/23S rRNA pseudouridine746 synthase
VHRLDRAASVLILLAHDKKAAAALAALFERRELKKSYRVTVHGRTPAVLTLSEALDERAAVTHFRTLAYQQAADCSLLDVTIETGRKHQIRRHLAAAGFPVVGDRLYGRAGDCPDLQLTARHLQFVCPLTQAKKDFQLRDELLPVL